MSTPTLFLRLTGEGAKAEALEASLADPGHPLRFQAEATSFELVPGAPFAYWVSDAIRLGFQKLPPFEAAGRVARVGLQTSEDSRFVRLWWEPLASKIDTVWFHFAKGGSYSPYYADLHLTVRWDGEGAQIRSFPKAYIRNEGDYFRHGLTWPLRTQKGLGLRAMPAGCAFGHKGPAAFVAGDDPEALLALLATTTSAAFRGLVGLQMAFGSYEVGVIQRTPVPPLLASDEAFLAQRARDIWAPKQHRDQVEETSHAFLLPALLMVEGETLRDRTEAWAQRLQTDDNEIQRLQTEIDAKCWELYGIAEADRQALMDPGAMVVESEEDAGPEAGEGDDDGEATANTTPEGLAEDFTSWLFGVALGRWDAGLATGGTLIPPLPGPFDKLPPVSRGMLLGVDGLYPAKDAAGRFMPEHDLLLDDEGESLDLVRRVRDALERVAGERADAWLQELEGLLGCDLRTWYRRTYFERHLKRHSKSRRKAPLYWQLGTNSGSYSVWLYYPRLTRDSLFRLLKLVKDKVIFEENQLAGMREQNARRSELELQEALVEELQAFRDEVARVTPLFDPNLDDGVLLNAAPLHRLFVHAGWRRDTQTAWTQLVRGDFDWAHMALKLWPERVIPKCAAERHLALAHALEGPLKTRSSEDLVAEHTRPAVKEALHSLVSATPQAGGRSAGRPTRAPRATRTPPQLSEPRAAVDPTPRAPRASADVPEATLTAIREALSRFPSGAGKSDVLSATGIADGIWNSAIAQLLASGEVERQGEKRGTRYFLAGR